MIFWEVKFSLFSNKKIWVNLYLFWFFSLNSTNFFIFLKNWPNFRYHKKKEKKRKEKTLIYGIRKRNPSFLRRVFVQSLVFYTEKNTYVYTQRCSAFHCYVRFTLLGKLGLLLLLLLFSSVNSTNFSIFWKKKKFAKILISQKRNPICTYIEIPAFKPHVFIHRQSLYKICTYVHTYVHCSASLQFAVSFYLFCWRNWDYYSWFFLCKLDFFGLFSEKKIAKFLIS